MPSRVIRGEFNTSESMAQRSLFAELMFAKLILAADDYGRFDARLKILRGQLYPLRDDLSLSDIMDWLIELTTGVDPPVGLYIVDDRPYLQLRGWEKHRGKTKRAGNSKYPEMPESSEDPPEGNGDPRGSAGTGEGELSASPEIRGDPPVGKESSVRGKESSGVYGAEAPTPTPTPKVSGFVSMLKGQTPVGLGGETWDTPHAWFQSHADLMTAEAQLKAECDSGPQFNRAFKSVMLRFWNNKAPPSRGGGSAGKPTKQEIIRANCEREGHEHAEGSHGTAQYGFPGIEGEEETGH